MRTRITNITLTPGVQGQAHIPFINHAEVHVVGNRIEYAGEAANAPPFVADETIDGSLGNFAPLLFNHLVLDVSISN